MALKYFSTYDWKALTDFLLIFCLPYYWMPRRCLSGGVDLPIMFFSTYKACRCHYLQARGTRYRQVPLLNDCHEHKYPLRNRPSPPSGSSNKPTLSPFCQ